MKIITGTTGVAHITPKQDAMWHRGLMGMSTCVFEEGRNFEPEIMDNSTVRLYDGICSVQGRFMCIEPGTYDEVTIDNGTQGQKRIDLICGKITIGIDGKSIASIEVLKGTPSAGTPISPTVPETDLDGEDMEAYIPLVKVSMNGVVLNEVTFIGEIYSVGGQSARLCTLTPSGWAASGDYYEQTITVDKITENNPIWVATNSLGTGYPTNLEYMYLLSAKKTSATQLSFLAYEKPSNNLYLLVKGVQ